MKKRRRGKEGKRTVVIGRVGFLHCNAPKDKEEWMGQHTCLRQLRIGVQKMEEGRTAWYEGVNVVILCRFLACSKKNSLTFSAI
jgi:hypothetical protein